MRFGVVALVAASVLLAGCASTVPPALTAPETDALVLEQRELWWNSMFPDEPMPVIDVIEVAAPTPRGELSNASRCLSEVGAEWTRTTGDGFVLFTGSAEQMRDYMRAQFECTMAYPVDTSDPHHVNMYSEAELAYQQRYFRDRLVPCLTALGYSVGTIPREDFSNGPYLLWSPYWDLTPIPETAANWAAIDLRCPPPRIGDLQYRPLASDYR